MTMMTPTKAKYLKIATQYTESELCQILGVTTSSIRRYAKEFNVKPKPNKFSNHDLEWYKAEFEKRYDGKLVLIGDLARKKNRHVEGRYRCLRCGHEQIADINAKFRMKTVCNACDKGHYGNEYTIQAAESMLNKDRTGQWSIVKYGHYSQKDSVIRCNLCKREITVDLADFINTTTKRCAVCQTGSFGEYVIANTLNKNGIPFQREVPVVINGHRYRIDFIVNGKIAIEYSGAQHFNKGLYYNEKINNGIKKKREWCMSKNLEFTEIVATYTIKSVVDDLSRAIGQPLEIPDGNYFAANNPEMPGVLDYMRTHSSRQTSKDLHVSIPKIKKFVALAGYKSISEWQADNKID